MINKINNIKLKKSKYFYLLIMELIVFTIGFSIAWWNWTSSIKANVYGVVCAPEIVFVGGNTINGTDMIPTRTKEEGLTKDININLNNTCYDDKALINLNLVLEAFPDGLADASFKWELYKVTTEEGISNETLTYISTGNFFGRVQDVTGQNPINLATDLIVTENINTYRLFIWIDAHMDNPSAMGDKTFTFRIYGNGTGAIYNTE